MMNFLYKAYSKIENLYLRKQYTNGDITILTPNCLGGVLYHKLGLRFNSPTINLWMFPKDFYKFVLNLNYYLLQDVYSINSNRNYPVGQIGEGDKVITLYFQHYNSFAEAKLKWDIRKQRIIKDKIYVIGTDRDGITFNDIKQIGTAAVHKIIIFTAKHYDVPYTLQLSAYKNCDQVGNFMIDDRSPILKKYSFEKDFDILDFFNS